MGCGSQIQYQQVQVEGVSRGGAEEEAGNCMNLGLSLEVSWENSSEVTQGGRVGRGEGSGLSMQHPSFRWP